MSPPRLLCRMTNWSMDYKGCWATILEPHKKAMAYMLWYSPHNTTHAFSNRVARSWQRESKHNGLLPKLHGTICGRLQRKAPSCPLGNTGVEEEHLGSLFMRRKQKMSRKEYRLFLNWRNNWRRTARSIAPTILRNYTIYSWALFT